MICAFLSVETRAGLYFHVVADKSKLTHHGALCGIIFGMIVACAVGFEDQSYFTRIFKRQVGVPPGKYRANNMSA